MTRKGRPLSMGRYEAAYVAKHAFALSILCWFVTLVTAGADVLDDLKTVKIGGRKYVETQILYIANDIEERGNEALANVGKDGFSVRMGGVMGYKNSRLTVGRGK